MHLLYTFPANSTDFLINHGTVLQKMAYLPSVSLSDLISVTAIHLTHKRDEINPMYWTHLLLLIVSELIGIVMESLCHSRSELLPSKPIDFSVFQTGITLHTITLSVDMYILSSFQTLFENCSALKLSRAPVAYNRTSSFIWHTLILSDLNSFFLPHYQLGLTDISQDL